MPLSPEILERVTRVTDYHTKSKLTQEAYASHPQLDPATQPRPYRMFSEHPKVDLPRNVLDMPDYALPLMFSGISVMPESRQQPRQELRTLASWLYMSAAQTQAKKN